MLTTARLAILRLAGIVCPHEEPSTETPQVTAGARGSVSRETPPRWAALAK